MSIEYLRQFKVSGYAVFDFAASFLGMFLLSPLLSGLARRAGWQVPRLNWVFLALPLGIAAHLAGGSLTPMTRDFMDPGGHYLVKAAVIIFTVLGLRNIKRLKKDQQTSHHMKNIILYCNPNPQSFCHAILETVLEGLKEKGQEAEVRDLYALNFSPVKTAADLTDIKSGRVSGDIRAEQELLLKADRVIVIYPVWWAGLPAMLKGYIDRVFSYGFAYSYDFKDLSTFKLAGKEVCLFTTMGAPNFFYRLTLMLAAMAKTSDGGIFKFCKMKVKEHAWFGGVPSSTDKKRAAYLARVRAMVAGL